MSSRTDQAEPVPPLLQLAAFLDVLVGVAALLFVAGALVLLASPSLDGDWTWFWLVLLASPAIAVATIAAARCILASNGAAARRWQRRATWTLPVLGAAWLSMGRDATTGLAGGWFLLPPALLLIGADGLVRRYFRAHTYP